MTAEKRVTDMEFDPLSVSFARDPYAVYAQLRQSEEPFYFAQADMHLLSRFDDVAQICTNPNMVRSLKGIETEEEAANRQRQMNWHEMPFHERVVQFSLLDSDGEIHRRLRKLVFGSFTTRNIAGLEPMVQTFVDGLLDDLRGRDQIDFIADFAAHVPGYVIGQLLGVPAQDCTQLRKWSEDVVQFFDVDRSAERKERAETASREFFEYLTDLKRERSREPKDDLISKMLVDERAGHYTPDEFISTCMLILMAGHGSTIDVLGSGMHIVAKDKALQQELRQTPSDLPVAIQEMFRFEPPLPFFHRHALEDITLRGQFFPAGTTFGLLYGAANRDPNQFDEPDSFSKSRTPNRHLAFGLGAHLCLGNNLARLNMRIIFETLLRRFSNISVTDEEVIYKCGLSVRGPKSLNVVWE